jgi:hypothetical protein
MPDYAQYQNEVRADVADTLQGAQCQPILFIGSGFSLRYASGPNWDALLTKLAEGCPNIDKDFAYYRQKYDGDLTKVGSHFAKEYFEWAWSKEGKKQFPPELFSAATPRDAYLKYKAAELLQDLTTANANKELLAELDCLRKLASRSRASWCRSRRPAITICGRFGLLIYWNNMDSARRSMRRLFRPGQNKFNIESPARLH